MLSINNSNRLETYARFKHEFCYEKHLDIITENKYRKAITQFGLSSHDLAIERGRYQNIDRQERICNFCTGKLVSLSNSLPALQGTTTEIYEVILLPLANT